MSEEVPRRHWLSETVSTSTDTIMHLPSDPKVEIGLREQGTVNLAFGVSVILLHENKAAD